MANDLGGGSRGEGGPLNDAASLTIPNPNTGRTLQDHGTRNESIETFPQRKIDSELDETIPATQLSFQSELEESLQTFGLSTIGVTEVTEDVNILVAKPPKLRKSTFDNSDETLTAELDIITYLSAGRRKIEKFRDGGTLELFEIIDPPYNTDDRMYALEANATGLSGITLQDLNVANRRWVNEEPRQKKFIIKVIHEDYYDCHVVDPITGLEITPDPDVFIKVAKPEQLRGAYWNGQTIDGISYSGGAGEFQTRSGVNGTTESQLVIPVILVGQKIRASRQDDGSGVATILWEQDNQEGHAWSKVFVAV